MLDRAPLGRVERARRADNAADRLLIHVTIVTPVPSNVRRRVLPPFTPLGFARTRGPDNRPTHSGRLVTPRPAHTSVPAHRATRLQVDDGTSPQSWRRYDRLLIRSRRSRSAEGEHAFHRPTSECYNAAMS